MLGGQYLYQRTETAFCQALPAPNVGPDADQDHASLIKPAHSLNATFDRSRSDLQPRGCKHISQEIKAAADPTDEVLLGCCSTFSSAKVSCRPGGIAARSFQRVGAEDHPVIHPSLGKDTQCAVVTNVAVQCQVA